MKNPYLHWAIIVLWLLAAGAGCQREEIVQYQAPKDLGSTGGTPDKMIVGGIIFRGGDVWFFKLMGPAAEVRNQAKAFESIFRSAEIKGQEAEWTLPQGWQKQAGSATRYATLKHDRHASLDGSVTQLALQGEDPVTYLQNNINRWCDQIGMSEPEDISRVAKLVRTDKGYNGIWVDLDGVEPEPPAETPKISYDTPPGWEQGQASEIRKVSLVVRDGDRKAELTVTALPGAANPLLLNVNRWRVQVALPEIDEEQLAKDAKEFPIGDLKASYVELAGKSMDGAMDETILGVVLYREELAWFIKLRGPSDLVQREKTNFESFMRSLKFTEQ